MHYITGSNSNTTESLQCLVLALHKSQNKWQHYSTAIIWC